MDAQTIYALVSAIPKGQVATYGQLARALGAPRHARAVGRALSQLPEGSEVPWHRVVNAQGRVSQRGEPIDNLQRRLLETEGVCFDERARVNLRHYRVEL